MHKPIVRSGARRFYLVCRAWYGRRVLGVLGLQPLRPDVVRRLGAFGGALLDVRFGFALLVEFLAGGATLFFGLLLHRQIAGIAVSTLLGLLISSAALLLGQRLTRQDTAVGIVV